MGLSTAWQLSKRNARTLVLEQFTYFNQLGSSAGVSRQFRIPYPEEYMVKLVKQSIPFWDELQSLTPVQLRDKVGTLWFGDPNVHSTEGNIGEAEKALKAEHVPYTTLNAAEIEREYHFKDLPKTYKDLLGKGVKTMREPNYVAATGRTTVNLRDPDGWRMQLVDADRKAPQT